MEGWHSFECFLFSLLGFGLRSHTQLETRISGSFRFLQNKSQGGEPKRRSLPEASCRIPRIHPSRQVPCVDTLTDMNNYCCNKHQSSYPQRTEDEQMEGIQPLHWTNRWDVGCTESPNIPKDARNRVNVVGPSSSLLFLSCQYEIVAERPSRGLNMGIYPCSSLAFK